MVKIFTRTNMRRVIRALIRFFSRNKAKKLVEQQESFFQSLKTFHLGKIEVLHNQEQEIVPNDMDAINQLLLKSQQRLILEKVGTNFYHQLYSPSQLVIHFFFQPKYQLPEELYALTPTGKLSRRKISDSFKNELLQDMLCSAIIRLAREAFAILPISQVYIHVKQIKVNEGTGLYEQIYILSVKLERAWIEYIELEKIDPSQAIQHMPHRMNFKKTKGFLPIEKLNINEESRGSLITKSH